MTSPVPERLQNLKTVKNPQLDPLELTNRANCLWIMQTAGDCTSSSGIGSI